MDQDLTGRTDPLTGLLNIQEFRDQTRQIVAGEQQPDRMNAFLFFDIVDFKAYNEKRGFEAGDSVLREFSAVLKNAFCGRTVGRFSGDHFAVLAFSDEIDDCVQKTEEEMAKSPVLAGIRFRVGVCLMRDREMDSIIACDRAKIAADSLRGSDEAGIQYYDDELDAVIRRQRYIVENIDRAVESGYIRVYYQPVICSLTGELTGMEALARWDDPNYGLLPPAVFIPVLEEKHLIHKLDICMMQQVCRDLREWEDEKKTVVPVSFNLSRLDFELCDALAEIENAVSENQIQKSLLHIEITESVLNSDERFMKDIIDRFHAAGYQVWMDDFGSGYSSLNVMKDYDFDLLKIDMKFLSDFSDRSKTIIRSIVTMAKKLGIHTLAEGVETREHAVFLKQIGCEKQQGYYYSKPVPCDGAKLDEYQRKFGIMKPMLRKYYDDIGMYSGLDVAEENFQPKREGNASYESGQAAFIFEKTPKGLTMVICTDAFQLLMHRFGVGSVEELERHVNDPESLFGRRINDMIRRIDDPDSKTDYFRVDFSANGLYGLLNVKKITSRGDHTAYIGTFTNLSGSEEFRRAQNMGGSMTHLYTVIDRMDIMNPGKNEGSCVFSKNSFPETDEAAERGLAEAVDVFAERYVYPDDRDRYRAFISPDTIENRVMNAPNRYITEKLRIRDSYGSFVWTQFIVFMRSEIDHTLIHLMRRMNPEEEEILYHYYEDTESAEEDGLDDRIHRSELWDTLVEDDRVGIFWKDADRRFVGANRTFMKYYGFSNSRDFVGKNDEEIGWHVNPDVFKKEEEEVLHEGKVIEDAPGQCLVQGENRDISANKRPIYRNGRIIGLVGYFLDVTEEENERDIRISRTYFDQQTGVLNIQGLQKNIVPFVDQYVAHGTDFALFFLDIRNFSRFNEVYGNEFGDAVLKSMAVRLKHETGITGLVARTGSDHFVIVRQIRDRDEAESVKEDLKHAVMEIRDVNGITCTIYVHIGMSLFSEELSVDRMMHVAAMRKKADQDKKETNVD